MYYAHLVPTAPISCCEYIFWYVAQSSNSHRKCLMILAVNASLALIHILNTKNSNTK